MRALPGNVIVYFAPDRDEAQVRQWAAGRNLEIVRKLEIGKNAYVIRTEPGLASLETANSLRVSGEVVAAVPDWWVDVRTR
jgi:ribosomal protein S8